MQLLLVYLMAIFYIAAGLNHFIQPSTYIRIMPHYIPFHLAMVYLSGAAELLAGLLLLFTTTRALGAWLIIMLLIAIFPANIQMSVDFYKQHNPYFWFTIARLPLQFLLIFWAWIYTKRS